MNDNQKKFIPQLAIDTEFFHSAIKQPPFLVGKYSLFERTAYSNILLT
jgi:hypothetical protein